MLDDADEREARVVDVQPVGIGQAAIQLEHDAHVREVFDGAELLHPLVRRVRLDEIG